MAIGPIQYLPQTDPFAGVAESFQFGQQIRQMRDARAAQEQAKALEEQYRTDVTNVLQNPSARGFSELIAKYPKSREAFEASWKGISEEQRQGELRDTGEILASLTTGNPDAAIGKIQSRIDLMDKQGADSSQLKMMLEQVKTDPKSARSYLMFTAAHLPGGDKLLENIGKIEEQQRKTGAAPAELAKTIAEARKTAAEASKAETGAKYEERVIQSQLEERGWNVKNLRSQISDRAEARKLDRERLNLEATKFLAETEAKAADIGEAGKKLVNEAAIAGSTAKLGEERAKDLADRITQIGGSWGAAGSFAEWLKRSTGTEGAVSELRREYTRLRNTTIKQYLPPGPATDKDIALVQQGLPESTSNPEVIKSFLTGVAKTYAAESAIERAKADFVANNRGTLGRAKTTFTANGVTVKPGDDFADVAKRAAEVAIRDYAPPKERLSVVDQIPRGAGGPGSPAPVVVDFNSLRN